MQADLQLQSLCQRECERLGCSRLAATVQVYWNSRMRSTAGRAYCRDNRIELNPQLQNVAAEQIELTLRHELAHLLAHARSRPRVIKPHGVEWRLACADLGIPHATVTHRLPLKRRTMTRKWRYVCSRCQSTIMRVRPLPKFSACRHCCKLYNNGQYDDRFIWRLA